MKRVLFLTPLAVAALAGCAPAPNQIRAGQWELVSELRSLDMPGAPAELQQQARSQIGRPESNRLCLTEEQARNFLQFIRRGQPATCRFTDETYANGALRLNASCPGPGGQAGSRMSLDGSFTVTTFNAAINEERPNPTNASGSPVRMAAVIRGRRVGDCPAGQPALPMGAPAGL